MELKDAKAQANWLQVKTNELQAKTNEMEYTTNELESDLKVMKKRCYSIDFDCYWAN